MLRSRLYRLVGKMRDYIFHQVINVYLPKPTGSFMGGKVSSGLITVPGTSLMCFESMMTWIQGWITHRNSGVSWTDLHSRKRTLKDMWRTDLEGKDLELGVNLFPAVVFRLVFKIHCSTWPV